MPILKSANPLKAISLLVISLLVIGALGTAISVLHITCIYIFHMGVADPNIPLFGFFEKFASATSSILHISSDNLYLSSLSLFIIFSIIGLFFNIFTNNNKLISIWILGINLLFSLPTLFYFFVAWGMNQ